MTKFISGSDKCGLDVQQSPVDRIQITKEDTIDLDGDGSWIAKPYIMFLFKETFGWNNKNRMAIRGNNCPVCNDPECVINKEYQTDPWCFKWTQGKEEYYAFRDGCWKCLLDECPRNIIALKARETHPELFTENGGEETEVWLDLDRGMNDGKI